MQLARSLPAAAGPARLRLHFLKDMTSPRIRTALSDSPKCIYKLASSRILSGFAARCSQSDASSWPGVLTISEERIRRVGGMQRVQMLQRICCRPGCAAVHIHLAHPGRTGNSVYASPASMCPLQSPLRASCDAKLTHRKRTKVGVLTFVGCSRQISRSPVAGCESQEEEASRSSPTRVTTVEKMPLPRGSVSARRPNSRRKNATPRLQETLQSFAMVNTARSFPIRSCSFPRSRNRFRCVSRPLEKRKLLATPGQLGLRPEVVSSFRVRQNTVSPDSSRSSTVYAFPAVKSESPLRRDPRRQRHIFRRAPSFRRAPAIVPCGSPWSHSPTFSDTTSVLLGRPAHQIQHGIWIRARDSSGLSHRNRVFGEMDGLLRIEKAVCLLIAKQPRLNFHVRAMVIGERGTPLQALRIAAPRRLFSRADRCAPNSAPLRPSSWGGTPPCTAHCSRKRSATPRHTVISDDA